jgi:hypothetical protein
MEKYAQKAEPFQKYKIELLKLSPAIKKAMRKRYLERIILQNSTVEKKRAFEKIYKTFNLSIFLIHFDRVRTLYIDINTLKKKFDMIIYHVKN